MQTSQTRIPVLILGAGPVGLALANELSYRGVPFILLERGHGEVPFPAGEGMFSRTMEHLRRWGIADKARHHPDFPDDRPFNIGFATSVTGKLLALIENPCNADMPKLSLESPEGVAICPKMLFDPVLRDSAIEKGLGELRYAHELLDFAQDERQVIARVKDLLSGEDYTVHADYLAACDGARSVTRKTLDIPYTGSFGEGHNFAVFFRAPELSGLLERQFGGPLFQLQTVNTPHRPYFTTVNGKDLWRMSMYVHKNEDPNPLSAVASAIGVPMDIEDHSRAALGWPSRRGRALSQGAGIPAGRRCPSPLAQGWLRCQHWHRRRSRPGLEAGRRACRLGRQRVARLI